MTGKSARSARDIGDGKEWLCATVGFIGGRERGEDMIAMADRKAARGERKSGHRCRDFDTNVRSDLALLHTHWERSHLRVHLRSRVVVVVREKNVHRIRLRN